MTTRPLHDLPPTDGIANPLKAAVCVLGPALSHREWLQTLRKHDTVRVLKHTGELMEPATVTNWTPCYIFVGKLKFHRSSGWQVARQSTAVYRMKLRLVRDEGDA